MFSLRHIALTSRFGGVPVVLPRSMVSIGQTASPAIHLQPRLRPYSSSSSSKPSKPSHGTSGSNIAGTPTVRRSTRTGMKNSTSTVARERSKVPVVPSTDHLHPADVAVSAFFAQHRPVSISHPVPINHSETLFGNIFTSRKPAVERPTYQNSPSPADFVHIEVAVESGWLETAIRSASGNVQQQQQQQQAGATAQPQPHQPTQDAADSANLGPGYFSYRPFRPPPPPRAQTAFLRPRLQKQLMRLLLRATAQGEGTFAVSGNSKLLLENMIRRRRNGEAVLDENPERGVMRLLSVKRIRKHKMKKHKLKKLRKRTRSLRRRIESQKK